MSNRYPREAPKWVQATSVHYSTFDKSYVNVKVNFGDIEDREFRTCRIGWHDPFLNKSKSDVDIETQEYGWLRIWFNIADIRE